MSDYVEYPGFLPIPSADFSSKITTNIATTTFASGRPRRRRLGWGKYYAAKLSWDLSPEEYDVFIGWWEFSLLLGTVPFEVTMSSGSLLGVHRVLLADDPEIAHNGYFWKVSCNAVIFEKPEFSKDQVWIYEGGSTIPTFPVQEDKLDALTNVELPSYL